MNKTILFSILALSFFAALSSVSAESCSLSVTLLNQDPVHAVPGEYVKLVFQVQGLENPSCDGAFFRLIPDYPFSLDPGVSAEKIFGGGTFTRTYSSAVTIPYRVRIDEDALDEDYPLSVEYSQPNKSSFLTSEFNITVQDVKANFDMFVQEYDINTHMATIDVLNIGKNNVEALTAEVKSQDLNIKGSAKSVIGSLDASQDSTFTIEIPPQKADIKVLISYTDEDGTRRTSDKTVSFDPSYFTDRQKTKSTGLSTQSYILIAVALILVLYFLWRRFFRRRKDSRHSED